MQKSAALVMRKLRPDNARDFAELVTEGILQAAATGEALLDDELAGLARQDTSKFQRLNQRMQVSRHRYISAWNLCSTVTRWRHAICAARRTVGVTR